MGTTQLIFLGGLIGVFVVSGISGSMVERHATLLDRDTRDRIWKRQALSGGFWRIGDSIGFVLMLAGMLKAMGFLRIGAGMGWGIPAMATGLAVVCISSSARAWLANRAYGEEAPQTPASRSAFTAAIMVSASEMLLAVVVCGYVFTSNRVTGGGGGGGTPNTAAAPGTPAAGKTKMPEEMLWVDSTEALRLLKGKTPEYLQALVDRQDIRARKAAGGKMEYRRDDISAMKIAGLPSDEEVKLKPAAPAGTPPESTSSGKELKE